MPNLEEIVDLIQKTYEKVASIEKILKDQAKMLEKINEATWKMRVEELGQLYLTQEETLEFFGVCDKTLRNWKQDGVIDFIPISEKKVKYERCEIVRFMNDRKVKRIK